MVTNYAQDREAHLPFTGQPRRVPIVLVVRQAQVSTEDVDTLLPLLRPLVGDRGQCMRPSQAHRWRGVAQLRNRVAEPLGQQADAVAVTFVVDLEEPLPAVRHHESYGGARPSGDAERELDEVDEGGASRVKRPRPGAGSGQRESKDHNGRHADGGPQRRDDRSPQAPDKRFRCLAPATPPGQ